MSALAMRILELDRKYPGDPESSFDLPAKIWAELCELAKVNAELIDETVGLHSLSVRVRNAIEGANIGSVEELANRSEIELWRMKNIGRQAISEIKLMLGRRGLELRRGVEPPRCLCVACPVHKGADTRRGQPLKSDAAAQVRASTHPKQASAAGNGGAR